MEYILIPWFLLSILAGIATTGKTISGFAVFIISLVFSPIAGIIIAMVAKDKTTATLEEYALRAHYAEEWKDKTPTEDDLKMLKKKYYALGSKAYAMKRKYLLDIIENKRQD